MSYDNDHAMGDVMTTDESSDSRSELLGMLTECAHVTVLNVDSETGILLLHLPSTYKPQAEEWSTRLEKLLPPALKVMILDESIGITIAKFGETG